MNSLFSEFVKEFSGAILGVCDLFGDYSRVILEVCSVDFGGKTIQRVKEQFGTALNSLFLEGGVKLFWFPGQS